MKPKIRILTCGGTIIMVQNSSGQFAPSDQDTAKNLIKELEPNLSHIAQIDVRFVTNIDSSNMTPEIWDQIAAIIQEEYEQYDGFVITHGTDTIAYTASALSFALQEVGKPIVFTGAQIPGYLVESDAKRNLINAVKLATDKYAGVMLLFGGSIFQGTRVTKHSHFRLDAFESVNVPVLGNVFIEMKLSSKAALRHARPPRFSPGFNPHVWAISLIPGGSLDPCISFLNAPLRGIVLIAYGTGNLSETHLPFLLEAQKAKIPVVIRSQCLEGSTAMERYETGKQALSYGVIEAYDMSLESTITKLMWALDKNVPYEEMRSFLHTNISGEIRDLFSKNPHFFK